MTIPKRIKRALRLPGYQQCKDALGRVLGFVSLRLRTTSLHLPEPGTERELDPSNSATKADLIGVRVVKAKEEM